MAPETVVPAEELFPRFTPERKWQTFRAHGFNEPAVGVVYRDGANGHCGVPLGGIGTGYVNLDADGTFGEWTLFNDLVNPAYGRKVIWVPNLVEEPRRVDLPFLGLAFGDQRWLLSLDELTGVRSARQIHYWGHYPVADLEYELDPRVGVGLRAWAPFVLGDTEASNVPGAVFEVHVRNHTDQEQRCTLAFSFPGAEEKETSGMSEWTRTPLDGDSQGVFVATVRPGWPDGGLRYEHAVSVLGAEGVRTGGSIGRDGAAWAGISETLPEAGPDDPGSSAAADFTVAPHESRVIRFVLGWYAPSWPATEYINVYGSRFGSAAEVAEYLGDEASGLLARVLGWQSVVYSEERLPACLRESLVNGVHTIAKGGFYVRRPQDAPGDGLLSIVEAAGEIPLQETMCVAWWGDFPVTYFFPDLRAKTLRTFAEMQDEDGRPPFAIGTSNSHLHGPIHEAQYVVNGFMYAGMVDRLCRRVGDATLVREFYPAVKRAIEFEMTQSVYDDGLVGLNPEDPKGQPFDSWEWRGDSAYIAGHWIAALHIGARMADEVGDEEFASLCREWVGRAQASLEKTLWNASAGSYLLYTAPGTDYRSDTVLSYQCDGELTRAWLALPEVFPPDRVREVLATVRRLCVDPLTAGAANAMRPDGTPERVGGTDTRGIWPAANALLAGLYAHYGDFETGEEVLSKSLGNLVLKRQLQWDYPQAFDTHEGFTSRASDYYWGMSVWGAAPLWLGETLGESAASGGFIDRVIRGGGR